MWASQRWGVKEKDGEREEGREGEKKRAREGEREGWREGGMKWCCVDPQLQL